MQHRKIKEYTGEEYQVEQDQVQDEPQDEATTADCGNNANEQGQRREEQETVENLG